MLLTREGGSPLSCPRVMRLALLGRPVLALICTLAWPLAAYSQEPAGTLPDKGCAFPGEVSTYMGYERHDFEAEGERFTVAVPHTPAPGRPWLWVAEFFGHPFWHQLDAELLARGWHIAYNASAAGQYGSPRGVDRWNAAHGVWTRRFGLDASQQSQA